MSFLKSVVSELRTVPGKFITDHRDFIETITRSANL
jgi:hypothetical protein